MYISTQAQLEDFVVRAETTSVLAIDTEFLREKTYYPKLCLIQMATDDEQVIIDPLAISDLTPLIPLFENEQIVKLFHAGRQDLEIIFNELGVVPRPIFDTQVAAALLGHTHQIGYGPLVSNLCGVKIKKNDSLTDWSRRPLSDSQISYALNDVLYLPQMYRKMVDKLNEKGRLAWLSKDFEHMSDPATYENDARERYRRLKHVGSLNRRQLAGAREMAAWREYQAQKRNLPRKWVLTDEQIVESCKREPKSIDDLFMVRGMRDKLPTRDAREVLALVRSALDAPSSTWPEYEKSKSNEPNVDIEVDMMMSLIRLRARENNISVPSIASHSELAHFARGHRVDSPLAQGWRWEMVGIDLEKLLKGEICLAVKNKEVVILSQTENGFA